MNIFLYTFVKINMIILLAHYESSPVNPILSLYCIILHEPHMPLGNDLSCNKVLFCSVLIESDSENI